MSAIGALRLTTETIVAISHQIDFALESIHDDLRDKKETIPLQILHITYREAGEVLDELVLLAEHVDTLAMKAVGQSQALLQRYRGEIGSRAKEVRCLSCDEEKKWAENHDKIEKILMRFFAPLKKRVLKDQNQRLYLFLSKLSSYAKVNSKSSPLLLPSGLEELIFTLIDRYEVSDLIPEDLYEDMTFFLQKGAEMLTEIGGRLLELDELIRGDLRESCLRGGGAASGLYDTASFHNKDLSASEEYEDRGLKLHEMGWDLVEREDEGVKSKEGVLDLGLEEFLPEILKGGNQVCLTEEPRAACGGAGASVEHPPSHSIEMCMFYLDVLSHVLTLRMMEAVTLACKADLEGKKTEELLDPLMKKRIQTYTESILKYLPKEMQDRLDYYVWELHGKIDEPLFGQKHRYDDVGLLSKACLAVKDAWEATLV